ncbi:hypothetical protein F4553_001245 [Allocatelliglobosispora scoriae]|uniref:Peptidase M15C domain-containing protein n=1 Tax=Allocatelliglobosispora scoriae TaxID=643052 RepID=A0A841BKV0_9ACTN|nr:M15 family metallopeptidase [Allocatelliglobosispora scoriae]MBB5867866.1 hypothetical protein [Allocatelliglobosispora scoriae]
MADRDDYPDRPAHHPDINDANGRGWGRGWPDCQRSKIVKVRRGGTEIAVRREISELVAILLEATEVVHGYAIKGDQTGGFNCRAIDGSDDPSNHSWGLAIDLNWDDNPWQNPFRCDLPPALVAMWWRCGFFWGGWYHGKPDTMHFEYIFRPDDVAGHLAKAKEHLMAFRDDDDARALIFRIDGLLRMKDTFDNHVNNPAEVNDLARAIKALAIEAAGARSAAQEATAAAAAAREAAVLARLDETALEAVLERVVRRVLLDRDRTGDVQPPIAADEPAASSAE